MLFDMFLPNFFRVLRGGSLSINRPEYTQVPTQSFDVDRNSKDEVKVKLMDEETQSDSEDDMNNTVV